MRIIFFRYFHEITFPTTRLQDHADEIFRDSSCFNVEDHEHFSIKLGFYYIAEALERSRHYGICVLSSVIKITKKTFLQECQRDVKIYTKQHNIIKGTPLFKIMVYAASFMVIIYLLLVIPKRVLKMVMSSEMFFLWLP